LPGGPGKETAVGDSKLFCLFNFKNIFAVFAAWRDKLINLD